MFGQRTFFSVNKLVFRGKRGFSLLCCSAILKDCVLFKQTQSTIEIDVNVVKKHIPSNFIEKYVRLKGYFLNLDLDLDPGPGPWTLHPDPRPGPWILDPDPEKPGPWKRWGTAGYGKMIRRPHIIIY